MGGGVDTPPPCGLWGDGWVPPSPLWEWGWTGSPQPACGDGGSVGMGGEGACGPGTWHIYIYIYIYILAFGTDIPLLVAAHLPRLAHRFGLWIAFAAQPLLSPCKLPFKHRRNIMGDITS